MINIKFINVTNVQLLKHIGPINGGTDTVVSNVGEFTSPTEYYYSGDDFSTSDRNYYHFAITGQNVQLSGQITQVTEDFQFFNLFRDQPAIKDASKLALSAPSVKKFSYANMFLDCQNLTSPPTLSATTLDQWCYSSMFGNCYKLATAPALPATILAKYCYFGMFYNCWQLVMAPELPASTLTDWCYNSMFYNCNKLTSIFSDFTDWASGVNATKNWVTGIKTVGEFRNRNVETIYGSDYVPINWTNLFFTPLTFKGTSSTNAVVLSSIGSPSSITLQYKKNDEGWTNYSLNTKISLASGETVSFSGANTTFNTHATKGYRFIMTGTIEASGNVQSLMNYSDTAGNYNSLFANCKGLTKAPLLLATTLADNCYTCMFSGCTALLDSPQLPATTLCGSCYSNMFSGCTSLTSVPNLPASTMTTACYAGMFSNCTNLSSVPQNLLPATTMAQQCYQGMFYHCSNLTSTPILSATTMAPVCYSRMFNECSSLLSTPQLLATTLAEGCYQWMFAGCSGLIATPSALPATIMQPSCYYSMFSRCSSISTAPQLSATTLANFCCKEMFANCTSLTAAPVLSATTLAIQCYNSMFSGCSSLNNIQVLFTDWNVYAATSSWVTNVAANGTFTCPAALVAGGTEFGVNRIPDGWTVIDK